jgi:hypothetical protein
MTVGTINDYLYVSTDTGTSWSQRNIIGNYLRVCMSSTGQIQLINETVQGKLYVSRNYGETWSDSFILYDKNNTSLVNTNFSSIAINNTGQYQAVTISNGPIIISTDFGKSWVVCGLRYNWTGICFNSSAKYIYGTVWGNHIYKCINPLLSETNVSDNKSVLSLSTVRLNVMNYTSYTQTTPAYISFGLCCINSTGKYITGYCSDINGSVGVWTSSDYGKIYIYRIGEGNGLGVSMSLSGQYQTFVGNGKIFYSHNYGESWNQATALSVAQTPVNLGLSGGRLVMTADGKNQYFFSNNGVIRSINYGINWYAFVSYNLSITSLAISYNGDYGYILTSNENNVIIIKNNSTIIKKNVSLEEIALGSIACSSTGEIATIVSLTKIYVSTDYGNTWSFKPYNGPATFSYYTPVISMNGTGQCQITSINTLTNTSNSNSWARYLYTSNDYGATWIVGTKSPNIPGEWNTMVISANGEFTLATANKWFGTVTIFNNTFTHFYSANFSLSIGENSLRNIITSQNNNSIGYNTLNSITTGSFNNILGSFSGTSLTTGNNNTIIGYNNLQKIVDTSNNTCIGYNNGSNLIGNRSNAISDNNTFLGSNTALSMTSGSNNTFLGSNIALSMTSGSNNTFLGSYTNTTIGGISNSTAIGAYAMINKSNEIVIGSSNESIRIPYFSSSNMPSGPLFIDMSGNLISNINSIRYEYVNNISTIDLKYNNTTIIMLPATNYPSHNLTLPTPSNMPFSIKIHNLTTTNINLLLQNSILFSTNGNTYNFGNNTSSFILYAGQNIDLYYNHIENFYRILDIYGSSKPTYQQTNTLTQAITANNNNNIVLFPTFTTNSYNTWSSNKLTYIDGFFANYNKQPVTISVEVSVIAPLADSKGLSITRNTASSTTKIFGQSWFPENTVTTCNLSTIITLYSQENFYINYKTISTTNHSLSAGSTITITLIK